jgi:pyruvate ferredoxin oxidoreductase delta subunit
MSIKNGWNDFEPGSVLFSFTKEVEDIATVPVADRPYSANNTKMYSVADWRVDKPVYNSEFCIHCQFCWVYCPDMSIISADKKMVGVDYEHCKGCGVCVDVCPTNPKSLLMFEEQTAIDEAVASWPAKEDKKKGE